MRRRPGGPFARHEAGGGGRYRRVLGMVGLGASGVVIAVASRRRAGRLARKALAGTPGQPQRVERAVTVNRPVSEVFTFWRDLENLPRFMRHLERVDILDDRRSHWVAKGPAGNVEWDAEITHEEADRVIGWRALDGAGVPNTGEVTFRPAPGGRGTEVRVRLSYQPPGGTAGVALARIAGEDPDQQVREDLRHLKQLLECGEILEADERVSARGPAQRGVTRFLRRRLATGGRP